MKFQRVALQNFKCYGDTDLALEQGVTVVHGVNGSGKSSLLEACFFALYGSDAIEGTRESVIRTGTDECSVALWFRHAGGEYHLERSLKDYGDRVSHDCVLDGPAGETWEGATEVDRAITDLLRMDASAFVNCAYVQQGEVNKLIHASPSQRQDMLDDLLQLGTLETYRERASDARLGVKDVLDNASGRLDELESQVESKADDALHERLNGLETELAETTAEIERLDEQVDTAETTLADAQDVLDAHEEKREELASIADAVDELTAAIAETESERDDLQSAIVDRREDVDRLERERADCLDELEALPAVGADATTDVVDELDVECSRAAVTADDSKGDGNGDDVDVEAVDALRARLESTVEALQERINELSVEIESTTDEADRLDERADELAADAAEKRDTAAELEEEIEAAREDLADREATVEDLEETLEAKRGEFEDAPVEFGETESRIESLEAERKAVREEVSDLRATVESLRDRIEEAEALLEAGKCPECGQPVDESPHVDALDDDRETLSAKRDELEALEGRVDDIDEKLERASDLRELERDVETLAERRRNLEQLLEEKRSSIGEKRERVESLREDAEELAEATASKREAAAQARATADDRREELGAINGETAAVRKRIEHLTDLADVADAVADATDDVERLREERASKAALNDERRERLAEKRDRKRELEAAVEESRVAEARDEKERAESYIEKATTKLEALREERDDLQSAIGAVENELEELEALREKRDAAAERVRALESVYDEAQDLQEMYGQLRAELRKQNVETLERMLNETFELVYQNDSYSHIELSDAYALTVYLKDGETLDPEQLSGGERALFNLSLRCAIYRLLAEGVEGAAPLPPLILDEPTVFLDAGHVTQLLTLIETMHVEYGVEQILVVSHDEELVGAADSLVHVRKDSTTNRSSIEVGATPTADLLADD